MPRVGAKLRQRQAQKPVRAPKTTKARETSGSRNWHLHKSAHNQTGVNKCCCWTPDPDPDPEPTGPQQVLSTVVVSRLAVFRSELLRKSEASTLQHHLSI